MKIFNTAPFEPKYLELLEAQIGTVVQGLPESERLLAPYELRRELAEHSPDVLIVELNPVTKEAIQAADALRVLAVCRSGTGNVDIQAATKKGILVIRAPGRNASAVAEMTIAMMINIARNIPAGIKLIQDHKWVDMIRTCYDLEGLELAGRTAGIVGVGAVGRALARKLTGFNMRLLGYDPYVNPETLKDLPLEIISLEQTATQSDFLILLASVTEESRGMINADVISKMKPSAYLINMARSALIDMQALYTALLNHRIAGAAMDVHEKEPLPVDSPWLLLDNVILTPHLGGATRDAVRNHSRMIYEDLTRIFNGCRPLHLANPEAWEMWGGA